MPVSYLPICNVCLSLESEIDRFPLAPGGGGVVGGGGGVAAGSGLADLPRVERNLRQLMDAGAQLFAKTDNVQVSSSLIFYHVANPLVVSEKLQPILPFACFTEKEVYIKEFPVELTITGNTYSAWLTRRQGFGAAWVQRSGPSDND